MKKLLYKVAGLMLIALPVVAMTSCSDDYMEEINTDTTKTPEINPNAQLTTALLQTYGDFGMMDAYRCYVTGFTQYFAGGWNVSNYAGAVHYDNDMTRTIWEELYNVGIKNAVDAIEKTKETSPNLNAILRIHRVYLMAVLTDTYGDVPYFDAGKALYGGSATPAYDKQEDIYNDFFKELDECIKVLLDEKNTDAVTGDVTAYGGDVKAWAKYANSLRMRYAMRISDVAPEKAKAEFEKAVAASCGYISNNGENATITYIDGPFTLYDGARDLDFRVNALGEMLYGQDSDSPTFVSATLFNHLNDTNDPRLYRICRHYLNPKRSAVKADDAWNVDVTEEVVAYENGDKGDGPHPCDIGAAWWHNWVNAPANEDIPTLARLVNMYPEVGFDQSNYNARMMRPFLSIQFEKAECPGILMTSAEVKFLLAEAILKGWNVGDGSEAEFYFKSGIREAMEMLNQYYKIKAITEEEIQAYLDANTIKNIDKEAAKEAINYQAWILHLMNPAEGWANLRRSGYPTLENRYNYPRWTGDFTYDDDDLTTPVRLKYPNLEAKYNKANYEKALQNLGGTDNWHHRVWWDTEADHVTPLNP